jgi:hypothetical protein
VIRTRDVCAMFGVKTSQVCKWAELGLITRVSYGWYDRESVEAMFRMDEATHPIEPIQEKPRKNGRTRPKRTIDLTDTEEL